MPEAMLAMRSGSTSATAPACIRLNDNACWTRLSHSWLKGWVKGFTRALPTALSSLQPHTAQQQRQRHNPKGLCS